MKKFALAIIIVGSFVVFSLFYSRTGSAADVSGSPGGSGAPGTSAPTVPTISGSSGSSDTPTLPYKDGSYTGSSADAFWGTVQVKVVVQQGKITQVVFLQYPNERSRSVMINNYADPLLVNEAIQAQSTSVDIVSGATDTSEAFIQSLGAALAQAKG